MKVKYKGKVFNVQWPKRFDEIILKAAKKYKRPGGTVSWAEAEADGALKGLPVFLTLRDMSQRNHYLNNCKKPGYKKKHNKRNKQYRKTHSYSAEGTASKRELYANTVPDEMKKKHGWKPRTIWNDKQRDLLLKLAEKYRKSKVTIDWKTLAQDKQVEKFPSQDSFTLCKYYNSLKRKKEGGKKFVKRRREEALNYKYENYKSYRNNQEKQRVRLKDTVNEFLLSQLELR